MYNSYSDYGRYNYGYSDNYFATLMAIFVVYGIFIVAAYVFSSFVLMKIFKKAGLEGWKAWVPFYNQWTLFELGGYHGGLSLIGFATAIPLLGFIAGIVQLIYYFSAMTEIHKKIGKSNTVLWNLFNFFMFPVWGVVILAQDFNWNDSLGKESLAKGTILGYAPVEETPAQEAEAIKTAENHEGEIIQE